MTCVSCQPDLDHCHGTLVRHADGGADCSDTGCTDLDVVRHRLVIECEELDGGCGCVERVERVEPEVHEEFFLRAS